MARGFQVYTLSLFLLLLLSDRFLLSDPFLLLLVA